jgi:hypothetical protein
MSDFTPNDMSSRSVFPSRSSGYPDFVLKPSKIIRNGQAVWLYARAK